MSFINFAGPMFKLPDGSGCFTATIDTDKKADKKTKKKADNDPVAEWALPRKGYPMTNGASRVFISLKTANVELLNMAQRVIDAFEKIKSEEGIDEGKILFFQGGLRQRVNDYEHQRITAEDLQETVEYAKHIIEKYREEVPPVSEEQKLTESEEYRRDLYPRPPQEAI